MGLFIYVLLLSIWTSTCLNTTQSDGSSTTVSLTGAQDSESTMQTKMDRIKRHPFVIIVGVMSTVFILSSFCFFHYNCLTDDAPKAEVVKKRVAAKPSRSSKVLFRKYKKDHPCIPEEQPMLADIDKLSEPSGPGKSLSSSESTISSLSIEKSSMPSSTQNFIKPSHSKTVSRKSYRKRSLKKSHKLTHAQNQDSRVHSSHPNRAIRQSLPTSLLCPVGSTETPFPHCPQNQPLLPKSSSLQKYAKSTRHSNLKRSVSTGMAGTLSKSQLVNSCQYYRKNFLVCQSTSQSLVNDISGAKRTNAQDPSFPCEVKSFSKFFKKVDSRNNASYGNASDSSIMEYDSDGDSVREITIICNKKLDEVTLNVTPSN